MRRPAQRPVYRGAALTLVALVALPPSAWTAPLPTNQGVYRRWVWSDLLGSAVHIIDARGVVLHQRAFEPFGELAQERATEVTERRFADHPFEDTSGLYYMNARWYDPAVGRFLYVDPLIRSTAAPQSLNGYSYVENNPATPGRSHGRDRYASERVLQRQGSVRRVRSQPDPEQRLERLQVDALPRPELGPREPRTRPRSMPPRTAGASR